MPQHSISDTRLRSAGIAPRPLCIDAVRTRVLAAASDYAPLFAERRAIECADLLDPHFCRRLMDHCDRATFALDRVAGLGAREIEAPQRVGMALNLALSRPEMLRWVEAVTGKRGLQKVDGRVVRTRANGEDGLDWHNDDHETGGDVVRRLAITIGLSDQPFEGGAFDLRMSGSPELLITYRHDAAGTALIFDIDTRLEHRVRPVRIGGARRVFTGWFLGAP